MNLKHIFLGCTALLLSGCRVNDHTTAMIVGTKIIRATAASGSCVYDPTTKEFTFGIFNPTAGGYTHALVLENHLSDNSTLGSGRINTNEFQVELAVINYEQIDGPPVTLPEQVVSGNALIATGGVGITQLQLVTPAIAAAIGANSMKIRLHVQVWGRTLDGQRVKSSTYEYVIQADPTFVLPPPSPPCAAPAVAQSCEGTNQDTDVFCQ